MTAKVRLSTWQLQSVKESSPSEIPEGRLFAGTSTGHNHDEPNIVELSYCYQVLATQLFPAQ